MAPKSSSKKASAAAMAASSSSGSAATAGGMVFKARWRVGKLLGEGACASVHEVEDITGGAAGSWVIKVAALGSGTVVTKGKKKKDPQKKNADTLYWEHMIYNTYLRGMPSIPLLPEQAFGDDQGFRFLVMQRLGKNLMEEFEAQGKAWSPSLVADYGKQVLTALQSLHDRQLIFVDVKPENFMLGLPGTANAGRVYLVDFGLVARYTAFDGGHKAQVQEGMGGTPLYVSVACHQGSTPARRDDVEALGYVLAMFLRGGNLPWEEVSSDAECLAKKKATTLGSLCAGIPGGQILIDFLRRARDTSFDAKPDYQAFHALLDRLGKEKAAPGSKAAAARRGKGAAASSGTGKATKGASSAGRKKEAEEDDGKPAVRRGGRKSQAGKSGDHDAAVMVADDDEEEARPAASSGARASTKRVRQSKGKAGLPPKRQEVEDDDNDDEGEGGLAKEDSTSSWLSFVTEPVKFLVRSLSGVQVEEEKAGRRSSGGKGRRGRAIQEEEEEEDDVIDLTSGKVAAGQDDDDDEVMVVDAPPRATRSAARVGVSSSKPAASRQRKTAPASSAAAESEALPTLALEVIEGPHAGERFIIDGSGGAYGGREASGAVSLPKDRSVELKHCSIKPGQTKSQSLRIAPFGGKGSVILVNGVQVNKSGRDLFIGDIVHIGTSKLILQKC